MSLPPAQHVPVQASDVRPSQLFERTIEINENRRKKRRRRRSGCDKCVVDIVILGFVGKVVNLQREEKFFFFFFFFFFVRGDWSD
jgi:hypothetical protein